MQIREIIDQGAKAWAASDVDGFVALYNEGCEVTAPGFAGRGHKGVRDFFGAWKAAFPDCRLVVRHVVADGDNAGLEGTFEGTHSGPLATPDGGHIPATNKKVSNPYTVFVKASGGKLDRATFYFDTMNVLAQLGLKA